MLYPSQFKEVLKQLLTLYPDNMMYGSDAFPVNEALGAVESMWLAGRTTRTALAGALAELVEEGAVTNEKTIQLARGYLHDNVFPILRDSPEIRAGPTCPSVPA
jgi:hypothetical protein